MPSRPRSELRSLARLDARWDTLADRLGGARGRARRRRGRGPVTRRDVDHDPAELDGSRSGSGRSIACCAASATTRPRSSSMASARGRRRIDSAGWTRSAPGARRGRPAVGEVADAAARLSTLRHVAAETLGGAVAAVLESSGSRRGVRRLPGRSSGGQRRSGGRDRRRRARVRRHGHRRRRLPAPPKPG